MITTYYVHYFDIGFIVCPLGNRVGRSRVSLYLNSAYGGILQSIESVEATNDYSKIEGYLLSVFGEDVWLPACWLLYHSMYIRYTYACQR